MNNTKDEFIIGFSDCKDIAIELLSNTINILNEYDIQHFLISGTLLGHIRNKDFIEWDDDIDLLVDESILYKINDIFLKYNIQYSFFVQGDLIKLCFNNSYQEIEINNDVKDVKKYSLNKNDKYNFPFIDLFIYKDNRDDYISFFGKKWENKYFFPKSEEYFNNILVSIPKDPFYFLKRNYKNYKIKKIGNNYHRKERPYTISEYEYLNYKYIKKYNYSFNILNCNDKMFYEIVAKKGSISKLIKDIDNDDISFINEYKNGKYDIHVQNLSEYLKKYLKLNRKSINHSLEEISYCLTLFLLVLFEDITYEEYIYKGLKDKLCLLENIDIDINDIIIEDWYRISNKIIKYNSLNNKEYNEISIIKDISFITYTNLGYIYYTKNLIVSLEKCKFPLTLKVYCIDEGSYNELINFSDKIIVELLNDEDNNIKDFVKIYKEGWDIMMLSKMKCIHKELLKNKYVFYTDSDIVFENNYCIKYLIYNLHNYDILIQNNSDLDLCAGFMFIKSSDITINLFETKHIDINEFKCDQSYINSKKNTYKYKRLPEELFPAGRFYYDNYENINPFIIHFNWISGNKKMDKIQEYNKWYYKFNYSFHLLIATIGRKTLINIINSINFQLNENDFITIVYDNVDIDNTIEEIKNIKTNCKMNIIMEKEKLGYWGNGIRNKYKNLEGDFIFHGNDDDIYLPDAMYIIRSTVVNPSNLYLFNILYNYGRSQINTYDKKKIEICHISTQSSIIPNNINKIGKWGERYSGDYDFYKSIELLVNDIEYYNECICYKFNNKNSELYFFSEYLI